MRLNKTKIQIKLFYSYSHKDEELRNALETHLSILNRKKVISEWHDRRIIAGSDWDSEINNHIETADIILLLISSDSIASDYCYSNELKKAIERHEANQSKVIPIIVRPVDWEGLDVPFTKLQALPKDAVAVTSWNNEDEAWVNVAQGIRDAVEEVSKLKTRPGEESGLRNIKELLVNELDQIDEMFHKDEKSGTYRGLSTGLADLDSITDGLHNSELTVVASRPNMGKTDLVLGIAAHAAIMEKKAVAYFSLNLPADRIIRRLIASIGFVSSYSLLRGMLKDKDWPRLTSAVEILKDSTLYIDESLSLTLPLLKERLEKIRKEHGLDLVIIDSLQNLVFQEQIEGKLNSNISITKGIKNLTREFQVPILVTSSISPDVESRVNKRPILQDLDEMLSLDDDADTVIFIYRDQIYNEDTLDMGAAELIVAKNSNGPIGTVQVVYFAKYSRFDNYISE